MEPGRAPEVLRFGRAIVVGGLASVVDLAVLTISIRLLGIAPTIARAPALIAGSSIQFFGNRSFTFRAQAGSMGRQARWFVVSQGIAMILNYGLYTLLIRIVAGRIAPELVSVVSNFVIFVAWEYPTRKLIVFRV